MNIDRLVDQNYLQHPSFDPNIEPFAFHETDLVQFNEIYNIFKMSGYSLSKHSITSLKTKAIKSLDSIFQVLMKQARDPLEMAFVKELWIASLDLLGKEIEWHTRYRFNRFTHLDLSPAQVDAQNMHHQRYFFGQLSRDAIDKIRKISAPQVEQFKLNAKSGKLTREDLSLNEGSVPKEICQILNQEYAKLGVLDVVNSYTGCPMSVQGVALELSVPQASWWRNNFHGLTREPTTLYAHIDESISNPKSIVYLSDVSQENGPTSCYPELYSNLNLNPLKEIIGRIINIVGTRRDSILMDHYKRGYHQTMTSENFRKHFMRLPELLRFNSHLGWDIVPDSILEGEISSKEKKMIGERGTFIIFDGARLFHRGGLVAAGERLALQVIFSRKIPLQKRLMRKLKGRLGR